MLKVIIVDDEHLALKKMEKLLMEQVVNNFQMDLVGVFNDPYSALEAARRESIDLAFLDIEMPEINGFELAERLMQMNPDLHIIFVTAYQEYAVKAFEMNALDYLLKPVHHSRLTKTLQRVAQYVALSAASSGSTKQAMLCCLQRLQYIDANESVQSFTWRTLKAQELLAYMVHHHDNTLSKELLIELLWPDYDTERATAQLYTAVYQIRKIIKATGLDLELKHKDEGYRLVLGNLQLDVQKWEDSVRQAPAVTSESLHQHLSIMRMYMGDYLEEHRYFWAGYEQERIRLLWLNHVKQIAEFYFLHGQFAEAISIFDKIRKKMPDIEDGYFGLMQIYAKQNLYGEVTKQFQLISHKLKEEFDVQPSKELTEWYQQWKESCI